MKRLEDERIITEKRKINSKAFSIVFLALWGILIYRQFVLQQDVSSYLDIFILTIGISMYVTLNNVFKGFYLTYRSKRTKKRLNITGAIVGTIVFAIVQYFIMNNNLTDHKKILDLILSSIIFLFFWLTFQGFFLKLSEKKANEEVDDDIA